MATYESGFLDATHTLSTGRIGGRAKEVDQALQQSW